MTKDRSLTSVPEALITSIQEQKKSNNSTYQIDDIDIREFVSECWSMLSEDEQRNYRNQLETPTTDSTIPLVSKLAFDLNRGLQSAHDEASKNNSDVLEELDGQAKNFKYVNLSNSDLKKDQKLGIFADEPFKESDFGYNSFLSTSINTSLSTFPSAERLGHSQADKETFIDLTKSILKGITHNQQGSMFKHGSLDSTLTVAVAAYVDQNFTEIQKLSPPEQVRIGQALKEEYQKLYDKQAALNKKNGKSSSYPVEISSLKLANSFEESTKRNGLLGQEPVEIAPPKRSLLDYLREKPATQQQHAPYAAGFQKSRERT